MCTGIYQITAHDETANFKVKFQRISKLYRIVSTLVCVEHLTVDKKILRIGHQIFTDIWKSTVKLTTQKPASKNCSYHKTMREPELKNVYWSQFRNKMWQYIYRTWKVLEISSSNDPVDDWKLQLNEVPSISIFQM